MNTKEEKSIMQQLRDIRDKISMDIQDMNYEQLKAYFNKQKTIYPKSVWEKK